jgi:4-amino-4-deoxy-L-arabinose transferase-like glycosyltransferase
VSPPKDTVRRHDPASTAVLAGLIVLALVLRYWRLGDWNFQATEIFTLRDSLNPRFSNPRPLGYFLNYVLVRPFRPLDEFGLRFLPALFGALAIPVFYLVSRRLIGTRAALFGTLLLTVSPVLVMYSQLARYWSLVFLLSAVSPYALYLGFRERNPRALVLGFVTGVFAALAHPVAVLPLGGLAVWAVVTYVRPGDLARLWTQRAVRWGTALAALAAVVIMARFVPILHNWIAMHDKHPGGQFLLRPVKPGLKQIFYLLAFVESLTLPLALIGVVGIYLLWRERDRSLALLLTCLTAFPVLTLTLISLRAPVSTYYLLPVVPVFFMGAGVFIDGLFEVDWKLRPHWLLPATVTAIVIVAGVPTLISDYRDGRRYDFRGMARWLAPRIAPGDIVFSDQPMVLAHYLPGTPVERLRQDPVPLMQAERVLHQPGRVGTLWIVAPAPSHAFRTDLKFGGLIGWIYQNCQLRNTMGVGRVDYRQEYLQVYRCPPAAPGADSTLSSSAGSGR